MGSDDSVLPLLLWLDLRPFLETRSPRPSSPLPARAPPRTSTQSGWWCADASSVRPGRRRAPAGRRVLLDLQLQRRRDRTEGYVAFLSHPQLSTIARGNTSAGLQVCRIDGRPVHGVRSRSITPEALENQEDFPETHALFPHEHVHNPLPVSDSHALHSRQGSRAQRAVKWSPSP